MPDFRHVTHVYYIVLELQHMSMVAIVSLIAASNILISIIIKCKLVGMPLIRSCISPAGLEGWYCAEVHLRGPCHGEG